MTSSAQIPDHVYETGVDNCVKCGRHISEAQKPCWALPTRSSLNDPPPPQTPEPTDAICPSTSPTLRIASEIWLCTRDGGHGGNHEARDAAGVAYATWPQTDADPSRADGEPTEAERQVARDYANAPGWTEPSREYWADHIAVALASQRAEIHARYEQLAKWADAQADSREHFAKVDPSYRMTLIPYRAMAERIRMAADQ